MTVAFPAIVCGALLLLHARTYLFFLEDDAYISLRYADRLLAGHGLTWNDGEFVEGYSNLLWVLAAALLGALGLDLVDATRLLGLAGALAAVLAIAEAYRADTPARILPALAGGLVLVAVKHVPLWAVGGLETCLLAGLLAWALVTAYPLLEPRPVPLRAALAPGLCLGLACLTRPDAPLFAAAACLGLYLVRGPASLRLAAALAAIPAACTLGQLAFRLAYYGAALPNTAHAKLGFSLKRIADGALYLGPAFLYATPVVLAAGLAFLLARRDPASARRLRFLAVPLVLWSAYVVAIGGDTFRGRRHFVAIAVILALMVAEAAEAAMRRGPAVRRTAWLAFFGLGAVLLLFQTRDPRLPQSGRSWAQDGEILGRFLRAGFGQYAPLLAVEPAGGAPYASKFPAVDMLGLNDPVLKDMRPASFGRGMVGHELGDGNYTLARRPDILMFCLPRNDGNACFRGSKQILRRSEFRRDYRLVKVEVRHPRRVASRLWFRAEDGKLGISRTPHQISVPGFLLASEHQAAAILGQGRTVVARIQPGESGGFDRLRLPPGRWDLHVEAEGMPLRVAVRHEKMATDTGASNVPLRLDVRIGHRIDLELRNTSQRPTTVTRVVLSRAP